MSSSTLIAFIAGSLITLVVVLAVRWNNKEKFNKAADKAGSAIEQAGDKAEELINKVRK